MNVLHNVQREAITVEQQVFLVFDVVVERPFGHM